MNETILPPREERWCYGFRKSLEAVKTGVPLEQYASEHTELKPFGGKAWFIGRCPLPDHEDKTPSFYIYPPGRWYCYGCDRWGDVVDLCREIESHVELWSAMISLAERYNVALYRRSHSWHEWQSEKYRRLNEMRNVLADSYQRRLFELYVEYLAGIEDPHERKREASALWRGLRATARSCAEWRISQRGEAA